MNKFRIAGHCVTLRIKDPPSEHHNLIIWLELAIRYYIHSYAISLAPDENILMGVNMFLARNILIKRRQNVDQVTFVFRRPKTFIMHAQIVVYVSY